jgi:osmoprotectant transport system substrate-binding protein
MRKTFRIRTVGATVLALALVASACGDDDASGDVPADGPTITVGSTNFGEQLIVGEIYAQAMETAGYPVERSFNLGSREVVNPALKSGEIDLLVEYTGTLLTFEGGTSTTDSQATYDSLVEALSASDLTAANYTPAQDKNGIVVTSAFSSDNGITTTSGLAALNGTLVFGGPPECPNREFCLIGLTDVYGLDFAEFKPLDVGGPLTVAALEGGEVDVALLFSSDGVIAAKGFVLLEDDMSLQPADNLVPVLTKEIADAYGQDLIDLLDSVSAKVTTAELSELNKRFSLDAEDADVLAKDWLAANGF